MFYSRKFTIYFIIYTLFLYYQKHLLSIALIPCSAYSAFVTSIDGNVANVPNILPPIHAIYFPSSDPITFKFIVPVLPIS